VLILKTLVVVAAGPIAHMSLRDRVQGGFYIAQIGELSFLLLGVAVAGGIIYPEEFQYMIAAAALTLAVTPIIMQWAPRVAWRAESKLSSTATGLTALELGKARSRPTPAVLIVGYGLNGRNVARVLSEAAIYHEILDGNPEMVRRARASGEMVHYGDATRIEVLKHLRFEEFDSAVLAISDAAATRRAVAIMNAINADTHLIVRTRYVKEVEDLAKLGADVVVPEEFETSLRIFSELLIHYHIPPHIIAAQIDLVRRQSYGMLRSSIGFDASTNLQSLLMQRLVEAVSVESGSPAIGKTPADLGLKQDERCFVISIIRGNAPISDSFEDTLILENDLVVLYGDHAALNEALRKFR
jgi:CPA2 family monovalent cation:H+ antiporter-2